MCPTRVGVRFGPADDPGSQIRRERGSEIVTATAFDPIAFESFGLTVKPMLAQPPQKDDEPRFHKGWIFDTKLDGIRALVFHDGQGRLIVRNRNGRDISHRFPELDMASGELPPIPLILDGEIVAVTGSFQDTAKRDKQNKPADVLAAMRQIPITFVAFDVLYLSDADIRHYPYEARRMALDSLSGLDQTIWQRSVVSPDPAFFDQVKALGMEGVIAKHPKSRYRAGRFSDWVKFKAVRSVTAIAVGYEPGQGARAHFGAMKLAMLGPTGPVQVGRVGTGFTAAEIHTLKAMLDRGEFPIVEIEALNRSKDGVLRFPVYKGLRTDLSVADARLDQMLTLPEM